MPFPFGVICGWLLPASNAGDSHGSFPPGRLHHIQQVGLCVALLALPLPPASQRAVAVPDGTLCCPLRRSRPLLRLEGWSHFDALYFSFITLTTIGYGDFSPSTVTGR